MVMMMVFLLKAYVMMGTEFLLGLIIANDLSQTAFDVIPAS